MASHAAYDSIKDALNDTLNDLTAIHFEDVSAHLSSALTQLETLSGSFTLESDARSIHSAILDKYDSSRTTAQDSLEV